MKRTVLGSVLVLLTVVLLFSCGSKYKGYKSTDSGLYYKFYVQNADSAKPKLGDILTLNLKYGTKDSVLEDTKKYPFPFRLNLLASQFKGDIYEGLAMMAVGDSASFIMKADSFFYKIARVPQLPKLIDSTTVLYFDIKLTHIQPKADFEKEQKEMQQKMMDMKKAEEDSLANYITANKIKVKPTESGLFFTETKKGNGAQGETGKTIKMHYTGTFLDGKKFDSSLDKGKPLEFQIGSGQVIPAWDEAALKMKVGGKAHIIVPSKLAYRERGNGPIPPFATLVFDLELIDVK
ncbi:MAG: FKBP-type peptidyl-prolyl cis-trans isomerase [Bacteroidota bacterium]